MRRYAFSAAPDGLASWGGSVRLFSKQTSRTPPPSAASSGSASASPSLLQRLPFIGHRFGGGGRVARDGSHVRSVANRFLDPVKQGYGEAVQKQEGSRSAYHRFLHRLKHGGHPQLHYALTNMGGIATYQLILEGGITLLVFTGLYTGNFTPSGLRWLFEDVACLPASWVGIEGAVYEDDKRFYLWRKMGMYSIEEDAATGARSVARDDSRVEPLFVLPKELLTQMYMGHNIAIVLMPLQIPFLFKTFPYLSSAWRNQIFPRINSIPIVRQLFPRLGADESVVVPILQQKASAKTKYSGPRTTTKPHA